MAIQVSGYMEVSIVKTPEGEMIRLAIEKPNGWWMHLKPEEALQMADLLIQAAHQAKVQP